MKEKTTKIIISCVVLIGLICGTVFLVMNQNIFSSKEPQKTVDQNDKNEIDKATEKEEDDSSQVENKVDSKEENQNQKEKDLVVNTTEKTESSNLTGDYSNIESGSSQKPSQPTNPTKPEKLEDLIITGSMIKNGILTISNKQYNTITIRSDIKQASKIVLNAVNIQKGLILENPKQYQLDVVNSNVATMTVANQQIRLFAASLRRAVGINKALEGATVNLNGSKVNSISINGNVEINGTTTISNVSVNGGDEVVLNTPSKNVTLNTQGVVAINQNVSTLTNNHNIATIIVNANVTNFTNNGSSTIRVNRGNTIANFKNQGKNTVVSGNGTIVNTKVSASDTRIYTNVTNKPSVDQNIDQVLIRKEEKVKITNIKSTSQGSVTFTLSEALTKLTIKDISVICNAGKSISLFNLTTNDHKTFTLTTSYYKNDFYTLYITLPNGNIISEDFDTDYANPTVNNVVVERISDTMASLELYGVDEGGTLYYILEDVTTKEVFDASTIKENGTSSLVKVGYNTIAISNLEPGKEYRLYYVLEGYFNNLSKVKGPFNIPGQVKPTTGGQYQIVYAEEEVANRFVFTLNKAPQKELTLNDFEIVCPQEKNLTTRGAKFIVSPDRLTYIIIVPDNYGHGDNKYTVKIKLSDTEKIEGSFVSHFNPPVITGAVDNVTRIDENTAEFKFNSDEPGIVYYGVYEWNGAIYDYNSTTPFANDVLTGAISSKSQVLNAGPNSINIDLTGITVTKNTRVWALFVDQVGNYRAGFVDHYKIPESTSDLPTNPENTVKITNFNVLSNNYFSIDFDGMIDWVTANDVELSVVQGGTLPSQILYSIDNDTPKHLGIQLQNYTLTTGIYELTIHTKDENNNSITLVKQFEIK